MDSYRTGTESVSTVSQSAPSRPSKSACGVICPLPVAARLPYNASLMDATEDRMPESRKSWTKIAPARIGPTVCEDDGPIPMENKSNMEITACSVVDPGISSTSWSISGGRSPPPPFPRPVEGKCMSALERGPEIVLDLCEALIHRVWLRGGHIIRPFRAENLANCHGSSITSVYHGPSRML